MPKPFDPIGYVTQVGQELVAGLSGSGFRNDSRTNRFRPRIACEA